MKTRWNRPLVGLTLVLALLTPLGCKSTVRVTDTAETGTQQLLLSSSADAVICSFDFTPLAGRLVYLDTTNMGTASAGYVAYRIREQMGTFGVRLADTHDAADVIVEAGMAAYGTNSRKDTAGITDVDRLPDFYVLVQDVQYGVAKLSLFAREKSTGEVIWHSGTMRADSYHQTRKVLGGRPHYSGTIQHPATRLGH